MKLKPTTNESKILIFHEINKTGLINESIEKLLFDDLLSEDVSSSNWFVEFALCICENKQTFFVASESEFKVVKESVRVHITNDVC